MDIVLDMSTSANIDDDDISLPHPRYHQYKQKTSRLNQEERRKKYLEEQKCKRNEILNLNRGLDVNGDEIETEDKKVKIKEKNIYANWIMLSVWLVDVPDNIKDNYYYVICPQGRRMLVVAEKGQTRAFTRKGDCMVKFPSNLPGGRKENGGYTVLDCIWDHTSKTYFILDVLVWGIPLTNCETTLRFMWLKNKFEETPELAVVSRTNRHKFILLDRNFVSNLEQNMITHPYFENNEPKVDGVIFYHKDSLYIGGKSPLTLWLKPFMIKDILGYKIHDNYLQEIPQSYQKNSMDVDGKDSEPNEKENPNEIEEMKENGSETNEKMMMDILPQN